MRGSLALDRLMVVTGGIIPAHAGLTKIFDATDDGYGDHPRACGAHTKKSQ